MGCYDNWWLPHPPNSMPPGCYLPVARDRKGIFCPENILSNAGLRVPVVAVGKLGYPDLAEQALRDGDCDMVMLARPLLADPEWPNKAYAGSVLDIRPCIGDQEGCLNEIVEGGHPQCAVNPRTGFEDVLGTANRRPRLPAKESPWSARGRPGSCACAAARARAQCDALRSAPRRSRAACWCPARCHAPSSTWSTTSTTSAVCLAHGRRPRAARALRDGRRRRRPGGRGLRRGRDLHRPRPCGRRSPASTRATWWRRSTCC